MTFLTKWRERPVKTSPDRYYYLIFKFNLINNIPQVEAQQCKDIPREVQSEECKDVPRQVRLGEIISAQKLQFNPAKVEKENCVSVPRQVEKEECRQVNQSVKHFAKKIAKLHFEFEREEFLCPPFVHKDVWIRNRNICLQRNALTCLPGWLVGCQRGGADVLQSGSQAGGDPGVLGHSPSGGETELCQRPSSGLQQHSQASGETAVQQDTKVELIILL